LINIYDTAIDEKFNGNNLGDIDNPIFQLYREDKLGDQNVEQEPVDTDAVAITIDEIESDAYDQLLHVEPILHRDGQLLRARVTGRKWDENGNPVGPYNANPMLNTRIYLAEFPDGQIQELRANTIVEAVYNQINDEGFTEQTFQDIIGHRFNSTAISKAELQQI